MGLDRAMAVERLIAPSLVATGYEIVRVLVMGSHRPVVQIMIERTDRHPLSIEDCAQVSRTVSALLDVDDLISGPYTLEVSSPGIDRPLTRPEHFDRFAGFEAALETRSAVEGRRRFRGRLLGLAGDHVRIVTTTGELALPLSDLQRAKLILTDDLIASRQHAAH